MSGGTPGQPERHYSLDEHFAVEAGSPIRHEYLSGEIFAMAGVTAVPLRRIPAV